MLYRTFGKTGWNVAVIGFGAWGIGGQWGPVERQTAVDTVKAAFDAGMNFFDTADIYGEPQGLSEEILAEALRPVRDRVFIATKAGHWGNRYGAQVPYTHPSNVELSCDASLQRLKTDYIDLYQCHVGPLRDPTVFLAAFDDLARKGKIRAGGISTNHLAVAQAFNREGKCAAVQFDYSYLNRAQEDQLLPWCRQNNVAAIVRGPLAQGVAAGKFTKDTRFDDDVRSGWNGGAARAGFLRNLDVVERLRPLERPGRNLAQLALQYVIWHNAACVAIPGAKTPEQARTNAAAADAVLTPEELATIRAAAPIPVDPHPRHTRALRFARRVAKKVLGRR